MFKRVATLLMFGATGDRSHHVGHTLRNERRRRMSRDAVAP